MAAIDFGAHQDAPMITSIMLKNRGLPVSDRWAPLQQLLEAGVSQGVFTAAVALVGLKGELRWEGAAGRVSRDPGAAAVTLDTVFDLASLTKPLATALALMVLADRGQARSSHPPGRGSPGRMAAAGQASPDPQQPPHPPGRAAGLAPFLSGSAGGPAGGPPGPAGPPGRGHAPGIPPGHRHPLQRPGLHAAAGGGGGGLSGETLDQFCREAIYRPLGLATLGFNPLPTGRRPTENRKPKTENRLYAATEPGLIPGRPAAGEVHDENAWAAGGVAGHAGLFGPGREVFRLVAASIGLIAERRPGPSPRPRSGSF